MAVMARKISRPKWQPSIDLDDREIPADAVTADLRTKDNALSFWTCADATEGALHNAVLALASAADRADRMDLTWIEDTAFQGHGISSRRTVGRTPVASLRDAHIDLVRLDVHRLATVAELVSDAIGKGNHLRMSKKQVVEIVAAAVQDGQVDLAYLQPGVRDEVKRSLQSLQ